MVIEHLPIIGSEHTLILVDMNTRQFHKFNNFIFKAKWLLENIFLGLVKSVWSTFVKGSSTFQLNRRTNLLKEVKKCYFQTK